MWFTYGVSTIVLVRSLFDIVVSLRDHVHRESPVNAMFYLNAACEIQVATLSMGRPLVEVPALILLVRVALAWKRRLGRPT